MQTTHSDTRDFVVMEGPDGPRLPQLPALDGLRGVAVAVVVLYHCGFDVFVGGYLGVSTFFTLSGFLITSLLLHESARSGTIALGAFWGRRFRRLLPASLVTLALVATLFAAFVATPDQLLTLRGDLLSSLFDVANWHFVLQGSSYGDLFAAPSPVLHFWSLAIEEQFYLLFPLLVLGLWRLCGRRATRFGVALAALAVVSASLPWLVSMSDDRVYFGTDTRAAELLVGGVLAVALSQRGLRRRMALSPRWRGRITAAGLVCLAVQLWWWWSLPQASAWLYRGGFALYALLSCVVILAATVPRGPIATAAAAAPLRWLGLRSYAIYLAHWPLLLAVRQLWPDAPRALQAVVGVGTALVLAEVSFRVLEQPVRTGRWPSATWAPRTGGAAVLAVAVLALSPIASGSEVRDSSRIDFESAAEQFNAEAASARDDAATTTTSEPVDATAPEASTTTTVPVPPVPRILTFGDSTALLTAIGLRDHRALLGLDARVGGSVEIGCPVVRFEALRQLRTAEVEPSCRDWADRWPQVLRDDPADVAQLVTGTWDVADGRMPGAGDFAGVGDPATDDFVRSELLAAVDTLASTGALVVMVMWPEFGAWADDGQPAAVVRQMDPARMERFHELQREVAALRPDTVRLIDLDGWLGDRSQDPTLRPDGVHLYESEMLRVYQDWLAAETDRVFGEWWLAHRAPAASTTTTAPATTAPTTTVPATTTTLAPPVATSELVPVPGG
jgi:peptidoglycan/LPS O-acetylase OafA/YrhL